MQILLSLSGHAINIEARNLVGNMHRCSSTKITFRVKIGCGLWSGIRDLLFLNFGTHFIIFERVNIDTSFLSVLASTVQRTMNYHQRKL